MVSWSCWLVRRLVPRKALQAASTRNSIRLFSQRFLLPTWHWTVNADSDKTDLSTVALDEWAVCELGKNIAVMVTALAYSRIVTPRRRETHGNPAAAAVTRCFLLTNQTVTHRHAPTVHNSVYVIYWVAAVKAVNGQSFLITHIDHLQRLAFIVFGSGGAGLEESRPPRPERYIYPK